MHSVRVFTNVGSINIPVSCYSDIFYQTYTQFITLVANSISISESVAFKTSNNAC